MRFRVSALALLLPLLAAGCIVSYKDFKEPNPTSCVNYSERMKNALDWSRQFPDIYPGLKSCMAASPEQPVFVGDVVPQKDGLMLVRMQSDQGGMYECMIGPRSSAPISVVPLPGGFDSKGPLFRPAAMGKPKPNHCLNHERVDSCGGLPLGWLSYFTPCS